MLLPIRTSAWSRRTPYANYVLIGLNAVVFVLTFRPHGHLTLFGEAVAAVPIRHAVEHWMLYPSEWGYHQFVTYAFLHGGWVHILGNMFFLYLFGNPVNDKLGHVTYAAFYLAGGVFAGAGHLLLTGPDGAPILGASGAVAAVTGAYLVLFPHTLITVLYWFILFGTVELPALWFIGLKMIVLDNMITRYTPNVAYDAHLAGYAYGVGVILLLMRLGILESGGSDLWASIRQWNRRRRYRDAVSGGYDPFGSAVPPRERDRSVGSGYDTPAWTQVEQLRARISERLSQKNVAGATLLYLELMALDASQVLPRQGLLDVANQLASEGRHPESARAYEQFLEHYGQYEHVEQIMLMVGLLYSRYLASPDKAIQWLRRALERLTDADQVRLCRDELAKLEGHAG